MATRRDKSVSLIGDILVTQGVLSLGQLGYALDRQFLSNKRLGQLVQDMGLATQSQVEAALAEQAQRRGVAAPADAVRHQHDRQTPLFHY